MSRLNLMTSRKSDAVLDSLNRDIGRRMEASPPGQCPVDMTAAILRLCHAQTCGKCVPCRIGLGQLEHLLEDVLNGASSPESISLIEKTARSIRDTADCAIGFEAAQMVLESVTGFRDDFQEHIQSGKCTCELDRSVPCVAMCPAGVDIPGYIALISAGRHADAIRLIRKDNPLPVACAFVCEHPCEAKCRRTMVDYPVNIRGLKKFAADSAGEVPQPECAAATGKSVAVIGGGASGLSAAYFLKLMGHNVTIYESRKKLGGMLRYGIPAYRLPREKLDAEIASILSTGIEVKTETRIGNDIAALREKHDAVYIAIGAHTDKSIGIDGEDATGVISAVEMLRGVGDGENPDFKGKRVVVIGGGNVAMDCSRTSVRLGAESVTIAYRRRKDDMPALKAEVEEAVAEGCEIFELESPEKIEKDENGAVSALWVKPQMIGPVKRGRPEAVSAAKESVRIACDIIIVAIGQNIEFEPFEEYGVPIHWKTICALDSCEIKDMQGVFSGGDCVTGPASAIKAIAAGKVAAANIDEYLGFHHEISVDVEIPKTAQANCAPYGRVNMSVRPAAVRTLDFEICENGMSDQEAAQEANRCLRCDRYGYGSFRGGRTEKW